MFGKKVQTVGTIREFVSGDWKEIMKQERHAKVYLVTAATITVLRSTVAHASTGDIMMKAFEPVIQLLQGASYPVAFIMITGGFLLIMMGQKHRGVSLIKWAALGYIGMQFAPAIMHILHQIGVEMGNAK